MPLFAHLPPRMPDVANAAARRSVARRHRRSSDTPCSYFSAFASSRVAASRQPVSQTSHRPTRTNRRPRESKCGVKRSSIDRYNRPRICRYHAGVQHQRTTYTTKGNVKW
jgi:hypothetical protein